MWLNCKVIKKVTTLHFYINPPPSLLFSFMAPFLAKSFDLPPNDSIFGRSYPPPPPLIRVGRFNYGLPTNGPQWKYSHTAFLCYPCHCTYVFSIFILHYNLVFDCKFIWLEKLCKFFIYWVNFCAGERYLFTFFLSWNNLDIIYPSHFRKNWDWLNILNWLIFTIPYTQEWFWPLPYIPLQSLISWKS